MADVERDPTGVFHDEIRCNTCRARAALNLASDEPFGSAEEAYWVAVAEVDALLAINETLRVLIEQLLKPSIVIRGKGDE